MLKVTKLYTLKTVNAGVFKHRLTHRRLRKEDHQEKASEMVFTAFFQV